MKLPSATKVGFFGAWALIVGQVTYWLIVKTFWLLILIALFGAMILSGFIPIN